MQHWYFQRSGHWTHSHFIKLLNAVYVQIFKAYNFRSFRRFLYSNLQKLSAQNFRIPYTQNSFTIILLSFKMAFYCYMQRHSDNKLPDLQGSLSIKILYRISKCRGKTRNQSGARVLRSVKIVSAKCLKIVIRENCVPRKFGHVRWHGISAYIYIHLHDCGVHNNPLIHHLHLILMIWL